MNHQFETLQPYLEKVSALQTALVLFEWDDATLAPREASARTAKVIGTLAGEYFQAVTDEKVREILEECKKDDSLTEAQKAIVKEWLRDLERLECIPRKEYEEFSALTAEAAGIWAEARKNKDFQAFAPTLKKILEYQRKFAAYQKKDGEELYDVMLRNYEPGFDMEKLDEFFRQLKTEIVPLLKQVMESPCQPEDDFLSGDYGKEKQEELAYFIAEYLGFDFNKGVLAVSAHPFTTNLHNSDVRITTAYNERVDSSLFSVIHEAGHGIYEMGIDDELTQTPAGQGASMAMHESQSRFFENIIGRNEAFWVPVYGKLQEIFPEQLGGVSMEQFVKAINKVQPGMIRTEADELTYSLHVMVRYELEKIMVEDEDFDIEKLPELWADKYEEYLGIRPAHVGEGVLQDIHWSQGSFGYFPSYALGSAFGAQLYYHMKKEMDFEELLEKGDMDTIREYLREKIHQYGKKKDSRQILEDVTGEDFTPAYYVRYLKEKYSRLYQL